jgi:LAS superfamily LD-carboxypeptidase LdcB
MKRFNFVGNTIVILLLTMCFFQPSTELNAQAYDENFLMGKTNYAQDTRFVKLPANQTMSSERSYYLLKEVADSLAHMIQAARKEGITIKVISASRNFTDQKAIWERKYDARKSKFKTEAELSSDILMYSSMPGTSRHHWGTDFDINSLEPAYYTTGKGAKEYAWMKAHASEYGFCQVYNHKSIRTGYNDEPWHWSFMPLSSRFLKMYVELVSYQDITGFKGSASAIEIEVIRNYVQGISSDCP